ncbi:MAG: HAD-IA family hydrolase [Slackia sp.]|nr:HAD-IA family hydrolase [Slackia sp.]
MSVLNAVLFDNDGTLVDTHDLLLDSFRHATRTVLGRTIPNEVLMAKVGQPLSVQMWDFADDAEVHDELLRVYRAFNEKFHDERISLFPGTREALDALRSAGFSLGVVTSKMHPLAQRGLEVLGVADYFDCLVGADDCTKHKPDPDPVVLGARLIGAAPERCAFVGDSPFDVQAGNDAGCYTAAVTWGMFETDILRERRPDVICRRFDELARHLIAFAEGNAS